MHNKHIHAITVTLVAIALITQSIYFILFYLLLSVIIIVPNVYLRV